MVKNERSFCIAYVLTILPKSGKNTYAGYRQNPTSVERFSIAPRWCLFFVASSLQGNYFWAFLGVKLDLHNFNWVCLSGPEGYCVQVIYDYLCFFCKCPSGKTFLDYFRHLNWIYIPPLWNTSCPRFPPVECIASQISPRGALCVPKSS